MSRITHRPSTRQRTGVRVATLLMLGMATPMVGACRSTDTAPGGSADAPAAIATPLAPAPNSSGSALDAGVAPTDALAASSLPTPAMSAHLTAEDEAEMVSLIRSLFGPMIGSDDPDMQEPIVRQVSTVKLRELRGEGGPVEGGFPYSVGLVWIVGFKTSAPLTLSTFAADETTQIDLKDFGPKDSLAGPDGRTSVYYVVATQNVEGDMRFVPRTQGVLVDGISNWSLSDLAALPATP